MQTTAQHAASLLTQPSGDMYSLTLPRYTAASDGWDAVRQCIAQQQPAVITDLAASWPALTRWTPQQLSERYGANQVPVYDASFGTPGASYMGSIGHMRFDEFLQETLGAGRDLRMFLYNLARKQPEMVDDIVFPDVGLRFSRHFVYTFFGCRGATTPLHYDIDMGNVLHTAVHGRRRVRLFTAEQSRVLYQHPFTVRSYVDLDEPDFDRFPALADARGSEVILEPGQTLFLPSGCWHEFHYLDPGFGVSLRASSPRLGMRLRGAANLLTLSPLDRLGNKLAPKSWFSWKQQRADARAERASQSHQS